MERAATPIVETSPDKSNQGHAQNTVLWRLKVYERVRYDG